MKLSCCIASNFTRDFFNLKSYAIIKKRKRDDGHGEEQEVKSSAEVFEENQANAGFDNRGKFLYTTICELVENPLDACESVNILPDI